MQDHDLCHVPMNMVNRGINAKGHMGGVSVGMVDENGNRGLRYMLGKRQPKKYRGGDKEHERRMDTQRERETRRGGGAGEQGAGQGQVGRGVQHPNFGGGSRSLPYCIHQGFHQY